MSHSAEDHRTRQMSPITHGETFGITEADIQTARRSMQKDIDGILALASDDTLPLHIRDSQRTREITLEGILKSLEMFTDEDIVNKLQNVFTTVKQLEEEGKDEYQIGTYIYIQFDYIKTFPDQDLRIDY